MQMGNYRFDQGLAVDILEKVVLALVILVVTWALARAAKWAFAKLVDNVSFFQRGTGNGSSLGESLGKIVSLVIWLIGLLAILQVFDLGGAMSPVQTLLNDIASFIPNLIGAALIFFIGLMIAKIIRDLTVTALQTVSFDKWVNRGGAEEFTGNSRLSQTIGTIIYAIIVIIVSIMALEALNLRTISEPASNMLSMLLNAIPLIIGAALLLGIGYLISRFVVQLLKEILPGLGVDRAIGSTDLLPGGTTISSIVARVAQIAIILFFAIAATRLLGFPELTAILNQVLELGGQVIFGAVVILVGFLIARMLAAMIGGSEETGLAATIIKWATIFVFTFMGLQFTGIGEDIIRIFFGALVIGAAVAGALAFGLGGRQWAGRKLEQLDDKVEKHRGPSSTTVDRSLANEPTSNDPLPPGA
ncbi:hypothetical protein E3U23_13500 [Erythrobacter litoralis]|uniref:mechanosensitive ion channel n=1 Tax=Erythrobacter litoralis TaxID=39960 RepID=UPI0024352BFB|nr:mechanosensitive ion channel [Erythrobacter litoralis]MDG6080205.1 hypothetical protein [Erythrobacter litoralis]